MSKGNTVGKIVGTPSAPKIPAAEANPPVKAETAAEAGTGAQIMDGVQLGLDVVGLIPGVGEIADLANAGISAARGDWIGASLSLASAIPFAGWGTAAVKTGRRGAKMAAEAGAKATKEAADRAAKEAAEKAAKEAAEKAEKEAAEKAGKGGGGGGKVKKRSKRKPKRRCELVPYEELECDSGQEAHHVVPDWMLRLGKRRGTERIPDLPSLASGPAICLESGSGNEHNTAHKHTDRPAQRIAKNGTSTGVAGTLKLGQAKGISARAIEKATGGKKGGGCDRKDIQKQLDELFKAHNDTLLRGVKDAKKVTDAIRDVLNGGKD